MSWILQVIAHFLTSGLVGLFAWMFILRLSDGVGKKFAFVVGLWAAIGTHLFFDFLRWF